MISPAGAGVPRSLLAAGVGTLVWAAACGGGPSGGEARCDGQELVLVNCSGCHDGRLPGSGMLDLRSPATAIPGLVGRPASGLGCGGSGAILVNGDGSGLLVDKLRSPAPCGERMPEGTFPLSASEIACVEHWVKATVTAGSP